MSTGYDYNAESMEVLEGAKRVRHRVEMYLGSRDAIGAQHGVQEIISNSIDEHRSGHGGRLEISVTKDNIISVRDYGRGVPMDYNAKLKKWGHYIIFEELDRKSVV